MDDPRFESRQKQGISLPQIVHAVCGTQPASYSIEFGILPRGIKRQGDKSDRSPPSSAVNEGIYTYTPLTWLYGVDRGNVIFTFTFICIVWVTRPMCTPEAKWRFSECYSRRFIQLSQGFEMLSFVLDLQ